MIKQNMIDTVVTEKKNIIKQGVISEKILLEMKMYTSMFESMEIVTNYYSDEEDPDCNNWTDVEGMGYGWAWLRYEEERWHEMMGKLIARECETLRHHVNKGYYVVYEEGEVRTYHFITNDWYRIDILIGFSNKEMHF